MAEILEGSLDASVAPARILASHLDRQIRDELSAPTKDGVWSYERSNFCQGASPDGFAADGKPATLIIGQAESSAAELLLEDSVLLSEKLDDRTLLTADPAGQGGNKDLPGLEDGGHRRIVPTL